MTIYVKLLDALGAYKSVQTRSTQLRIKPSRTESFKGQAGTRTFRAWQASKDLVYLPTFMRMLCAAPILLIALTISADAIAQDEQGPIAAPPTINVKRVPSIPNPGPPPIPEQQIIQKFAANEEVMRKAFDTYTYTQSVRFEEETDPVGMLTASGDTYFKDDERYWAVTKEPKPTLTATHYTLQDVMAMTEIPYFFLTTADIPNYNFLYAGEQTLDQINTYVFQVKPKAFSRKQRFFDGVIWVDDHDLAIVRSWGKFELEVEPSNNARPFTMFETYRENFEDKYWLPTYTASDGEVTEDDGTKVPVKLVIHDTNFKRRTDSSTGAAAAPANSSQPDSSSGASPAPLTRPPPSTQ